MRLLTRYKVFRSFPELDSYDDAQCRRFMAAAVRTLPFRLASGACWLTIFVLGLGATFLASAFTSGFGKVVFSRADDPELKIVGVTWFIGVLVAGACAFWARDVLVIRRLTRLLNDRGRCRPCGYTLVGLAVGPSHIVICPECGSQSSVDESLKELTRRDEARGAAHVSKESIAMPLRPTQAAAARRHQRRVIGLLSLLAGVPLLAVLLYGAVLLLQAAAASSARPAASAWAGVFPSARAAASLAPSSNAWQVLSTRNAAMGVPIADGARETGLELCKMYEPLAQLGGYRVGGMWVRTTNVRDPKSEAALTRMLDDLGAAGVWKSLGQVVNSPDHTLPALPIAAPMMQTIDIYTSMSALSRADELLMGRMNVARLRRDPAAFAEAAGEELELAHMYSVEPHFGAGTANQPACIAWCSIIDAVRSEGPEWTRALYPVVQRARRLAPTHEVVEGSRLVLQDKICWLFQSPSHVWLERWSPTVQREFGELVRPVRLGFYWENARLIDAWCLPAERALKSGQSVHQMLRALPPPDSDLVTAGLLSGFITTLEQYEDAQTLQDGGAAMVCIEQYRLDHGEYPENLQALVHAHMLTQLPMDPYSGQALVYERGGPKAAAHGVGYVLYSVGPDGNDDGLAHAECLPALPAGTKPGHDYSFPILDEGAGP